MRITDDEQLVAALPHLVGFRPAESLVLVWLARGTVFLSQRVDLPAPDGVRTVADGLRADEWVTAIVPPDAVAAADGVVAVLVTEQLADLDDYVRLADRVCGLVHDREIAVHDLIHLRDGRWRSLYCGSPDCCPPEGRPVRPAVQALIDDEFALAGRRVLPDRRALVAQVVADPSAVAEVAGLLPRRPRRARRGDRWRDRAITEIWRLLQTRPGPIDAARRVRVLRDLADARVRDTVLWDLAHADPDEVARAAVALATLTRSAPDAVCAPVATCCAVAAWLTGDGALSGAALERALAAEPDYSLARLVDGMLRAAWSPARWRAVMDELDRETCRDAPPTADLSLDRSSV